MLSFEGCECSVLEIKSFFLHTLYDWSVVFLIFLVLLFLFFLIVVFLVPDLCPHSTQCTRFGTSFIINNIFTLLIKKKGVSRIGAIIHCKSSYL